MGCDIHIYREKKIDGAWVAADKWQQTDYGLEVSYKDQAYTGRNYQLFGLLSKGVRTENEFSFEQRGMPFNSCEQIQSLAEEWSSDGHSHSYLYLHELKDMLEFLQTRTLKISGMKDRDELKALRESIVSSNPDWNLLYPYCQGSSMETYERFSVDVPASFYLGESLSEIINSFDGIDGENHRIVFFFDN